MKTAKDPRHLKRREIVRQLFALSFSEQERWGEQEISPEVWRKREEIDDYIRQTTVRWPPERLNKLDLAILRLAIYEMIFERKEPVKVIIDEAVEIAKEFGSKSSAAFVNGVLGKLVNQYQLGESD